MFFIAVFCVSWLVCFLSIKKSKLIYVYPTALLAMFMSLASDSLLKYIPLWEYHDPNTNMPESIVTFMDDFGIYPVIGAIFASYMPASWKKIGLYMIAWTTGGICVEWMMIRFKYMSYSGNWSLGLSYAADWIIFGILVLQYKLHLKLLHSPRLDIDPSGKANVSISQRVLPVKQSAILQNLSARGLTIFLGARSMEAEMFYSVLEPGTAGELVTHPAYEVHLVVEGEMTVRKGKEQIWVKQGEICSFPSVIPHALHNQSSMPCKVVSLVIMDEALFPVNWERAAPS